jgi:asparagine synthase (glutamine-hydrolysing)
MCGIVAISAPDARRFPMDGALAVTGHRGPDDRGIYVSDGGDCAIGHNRLSIFDLSCAGHQPMWDHSGRYVLTYNGEVYNFRDLRAELEARHGAIAWISGSDTEVVIEGFAREGIAFFDRMNGIFALAIYDTHERVMHVLRDPLGIKPLVMTEQHGAVFFCSELQGLLAMPRLARTLRRESFAEQIAFMYVPEPHTLFHEFRKVEPGVCLSYRAGRLIARRPLFTWLDDAPKIVGEREAIEQLRHAFAEAIGRQVAADVPVSLFLSGGLDSSVVAEQAIRSGADIRDAYTIAFSDADRRRDAQSDDLRYARIMAERLGIKLKVIEAEADFLNMLPELSRFMDGFSDPAAINTYLICAAARRQGIKVMLSGQGADEFLGGYRRYFAERALQRMPGAIRFSLSAASGMLPANLPGKLNAVNRRLKRFAMLAAQSPRNRILGLYSWATPATIDQMFVEPLAGHPEDEFLALLAGLDHGDCVDTMMAIDRRYDLLSLNLTYTDRMSMAVGVEARVPFLDFELVRVMNAIPASLKVKGSQGKYALKKAMEPWLPHEIVYRSKAGFGLPIRAWMDKSSELLDRYLNRPRIERQGIFNGATIDRLRQEQASGAADHANVLLTLLTQQIGLDTLGGQSV